MRHRVNISIPKGSTRKIKGGFDQSQMKILQGRHSQQAFEHPGKCTERWALKEPCSQAAPLSLLAAAPMAVLRGCSFPRLVWLIVGSFIFLGSPSWCPSHTLLNITHWGHTDGCCQTSYIFLWTLALQQNSSVLHISKIGPCVQCQGLTLARAVWTCMSPGCCKHEVLC